MKTNLRAQEIIAIAICAGPLHVLLETLVFTFWKEVNRGEKKSPFSYKPCSYTRMTVTKSKQWIAGSLDLVYWPHICQKLAVCLLYLPCVPEEGNSLCRFPTVPDSPPSPVSQVPEHHIPRRIVEITVETSAAKHIETYRQNTSRSILPLPYAAIFFSQSSQRAISNHSRIFPLRTG